MNNIRNIAVIVTIFSILFNAVPAIAMSVLPSKGIVPDCERTNENFGTFTNGTTVQPTNRPCELKDFFQMLFNLTEWFLAILGAMAFLFFLYGGALFVISFGDSGKVKKGQAVMLNTVLGIVVILGAYTAVKFVAEVVGVTGRI